MSDGPALDTVSIAAPPARVKDGPLRTTPLVRPAPSITCAPDTLSTAEPLPIQAILDELRKQPVPPHSMAAPVRERDSLTNTQANTLFQ